MASNAGSCWTMSPYSVSEPRIVGSVIAVSLSHRAHPSSGTRHRLDVQAPPRRGAHPCVLGNAERGHKARETIAACAMDVYWRDASGPLDQCRCPWRLCKAGVVHGARVM